MRTLVRILSKAIAIATVAAAMFPGLTGATPVTMYLESQAGDVIGQGLTRTIGTANGYNGASAGLPDRILISIHYGGTGSPPDGFVWELDLSFAGGFSTGNYEGAVRGPYQPAGVPGLELRADGRSCTQLWGRFEILEFTTANDGVASLAVDFEQHCENALPALYGQLRYNSAVPIVTTRTRPAPFEFSGVTGVAPGMAIVSAPVVLSGFSTTLPIAVLSGEYSVDGAPFTALPGLVANGQSVRVRATSAPGSNRLVTAVLRVGEFEAPFRVGTAVGDFPQPGPDPLVVIVVDPGSVAAGGMSVFSPATLYGLSLGRYIHFNASEVAALPLPGVAGGSWGALFGSPGGNLLSVGEYVATPRTGPPTSWPLMAFTFPDQSSCESPVLETFKVREVEYSGEWPTKLALDFEQRCGAGSSAAAVRGFIRLNSAVPINYSRPTLNVSVANGAGGTVASSPPGIACPPTCSAGFDEGVPITLSATPAAGASFAGWSGACSGAGVCQVTLAASASVTATFAYPLTVTRTGMGSGSVSSTPAGILCGSTCGATFVAGSTVTLAATPSASSRFTGWLGACSGTDACTVTMDAARSAIAVFAPVVAAPDNARHDWNGDGRPDLLLRHPPTGTTIACYMAGIAFQSCALVDAPGAGSAIVGVGDFSADGHTDLLSLDMASSRLDVWRMNGTAKLGESPVMSVESPWTFEAVGDFNADGKPDMVLRHGAANLMIVVFLDGAAPVDAQALFPLDASWKVQAAGDFDRDGHPDLVLRHTSGVGLIWGTGYAGGATTMAGAPMGQFALDPAWEVAQVADWNGDGKVDLLVRNASTGEIVILYCDGASIVDAEFLLQVDPAWEIVPRR